MKNFIWLLVLVLFAGCNNQMRAMKTGIGSGTITSSPAGINCGGASGTSCATTFPEGSTVTLTATPSAGSTFASWGGDCSGTGTACTLVMNAYRAVRAAFDDIVRPNLADLSPAGIQTFLTSNPTVDTAAKFLAALPAPQKFKENWILMSRSESLQTGTATSPRILLPSEDSTQVFSITLQAHASFPAATQNTIEYMQWDSTAKRFGFHEINLTARTVSINDPKCQKCHSGRPNWDAYDSWAGMLPFNRDRVYKSSVEAAALRKLFNLWDKSDAIRPVLEQLTLPTGMTRINGGFFDGSVNFPFDSAPGTVVLIEPPIDPALPTVTASYFTPTTPATSVRQGGGSDTSDFLRLSNSLATVRDEGRGVDLFDHLTDLNAQRIARELIDHPRTPVDVRPIALAIAKACVNEVDIEVDGRFVTASQRQFFESRNGMNLDQVFHDTLERRHSLPRRKADIQRFNLMGSDGGDAFVTGNDGLIGAYGSLTNTGADESITRIRQEVLRRPQEGFPLDPTTGYMIDREVYEERLDPGTNTKIALFRYFLEPLGVAVDKWSMSVRGRSRTYTFADLFGTYLSTITTVLNGSLDSPDCPTLIANSRTQFGSLPLAAATPAYADVQKIFNRNCTECHGGLGYPPYPATGPGSLDLSEGVSHPNAQSRALSGSLMGSITRTDPLMMPYGGPKLSGTDIETIRRWIAGGASQ